MFNRIALSAALAFTLCAASFPAQAGPYTGTGGGPETTVNAPYRSPVGQTVPPGRAAAPTHDPEQRTERQRNLDSVLDSICRNC